MLQTWQAQFSKQKFWLFLGQCASRGVRLNHAIRSPVARWPEITPKSLWKCQWRTEMCGPTRPSFFPQSDQRCSKIRAGNSLIGFPSESLVFYPKMSEWVNHSFAHCWWATWAIRSRSLISSGQPEWITHGCSFLVSDLSDLLKMLIFGEQPERFTHITHQKRGNEKIVYNTYEKS